MATTERPVPRIGDHLDELLDLLDRAREERRAWLRLFSRPAGPHLALARAVVERRPFDRAGQLGARRGPAVPTGAQGRGRDERPLGGALWSVMMSDAQHFPAANPPGRCAIDDRDALAYTADGSLDLYLQHDSPGGERVPSGLPAPRGPVGVTMRLYAPKPAAFDGDLGSARHQAKELMR